MRVNFNHGTQQVSYTNEGTGKYGRVKLASWYESSIKICGLNFNRGSLIDYLNEEYNTQHRVSQKYKKGIFGSSDAEIIGAFKELIPEPKIHSLVDVILTENYQDSQKAWWSFTPKDTLFLRKVTRLYEESKADFPNLTKYMTQISFSQRRLKYENDQWMFV